MGGKHHRRFRFHVKDASEVVKLVPRFRVRESAETAVPALFDFDVLLD